MSFKTYFVLVFLFGFSRGKGFSDKPSFIGRETNGSVIVGRDATLTCAVQNLHDYKVAWLQVDTQTVLTIGTHVITKNHRIAVSNVDTGWLLTIKDARLSDGGRYMCQVNTEPMLTQTYILRVLMPPDITLSTSSEIMVRERENVSLHCSASGIPEATITWRREDSLHFSVGRLRVIKWSGEWLNLTSISRQDHGAFLCIASNGVPPAVSKRTMVHVFCKPKARQASKMLGVHVGDSIVFTCHFSANPPPVVFWRHMDGTGDRLQNGTKYNITMLSRGFYMYESKLQIKNVSREDIGSYSCHGENSMGAADDEAILYTLVTSTTSQPPATTASNVSSLTERPPVQSLMPSSQSTLKVLKKENETDSRKEDMSTSKDEEINEYTVVVSQHQMQSLDLPTT